jgi:hypothetical protein
VPRLTRLTHQVPGSHVRLDGAHDWRRHSVPN